MLYSHAFSIHILTDLPYPYRIILKYFRCCQLVACLNFQDYLVLKQQSSNQLLLRTYVDDADPFVHLIYQLYTHTPSLSIYNHADVLLLKPTSHPAWFPGLIGTKMTINQLLLSTDVVQPF
jgi:hypothetical protein